MVLLKELEKEMEQEQEQEKEMVINLIELHHFILTRKLFHLEIRLIFKKYLIYNLIKYQLV